MHRDRTDLESADRRDSSRLFTTAAIMPQRMLPLSAVLAFRYSFLQASPSHW
jgi:hypothetical protein